MHKLVSIGAAAALAALVSLSAATPSSADPAGAAVGAGIVGGVLGFMAGAAVANSPHYEVRPDHGFYGDWRGDRWGDRWAARDDFDWRQHVRACFRYYGDRYEPRSDTFIGHDGYPHRCRI